MVLLYKYLLSLCSVLCFVRRVKIFKYSCSYPTSLKIMSANCSSLYVNSQCSKSFMESFKLKYNFWVESYKSTITREWIICLSCCRSLILDISLVISLIKKYSQKTKMEMSHFAPVCFCLSKNLVPCLYKQQFLRWLL